MNALKIAAVAVTLAVSIPAQATLLCRNDTGQQIEWHSGDPRPNLQAFDATQNVACFVSRQALLYAQALGLPMVPGYDPNKDSGVIYRNPMAKFLLDNVGLLEGKPATKADMLALPL